MFLSSALGYHILGLGLEPVCYRGTEWQCRCYEKNDGEVTDVTNRAQGFALLPMISSIGVVVG